MSLYINFEPHSYYKGFAIKRNDVVLVSIPRAIPMHNYTAYTDNGNTYRLVEIEAPTLKKLKQLITDYRSK